MLLTIFCPLIVPFKYKDGYFLGVVGKACAGGIIEIYIAFELESLDHHCEPTRIFAMDRF